MLDKRLKKITKAVNDAKGKARLLLDGKRENISQGLKRAIMFLDRAKSEVKDFKRQYLPGKGKPKRK